MEKKSLGRGLEDISAFFLSSRKEPVMPSGFSSKKLRDETCDECTRTIINTAGRPTCRIFSFQETDAMGHHMNELGPAMANYCDYFEPGIPEPDASRPAMAQKPLNKPDTPEKNPDQPDQIYNLCDIDEDVTIQKKIAYPDTRDAQQHMLTSLSRHLEDHYRIRRIELKKTNTTSLPKRRSRIDEKITIYIKEEI